MGTSVFKRDSMKKYTLTIALLIIFIINYGECVEENSSSSSDQQPQNLNRPRKMYYVCPPDFVRLGSSCFYFSTEKASWQDAHFNCKDRDSNLTSPQRWEDRNLREYLTKPEIDRHERWIGGVYDWESRSWKWGRNMKEMQYQSFSRLRKLSSDSLRWHCVAMSPEILYRWVPRSCIESKHYICQTRLQKVRRSDRNKLRQRWNPSGNGHKPNEIPAPVVVDSDNYNNINPNNDLNANPFDGTKIDPNNIQVNYGHHDNNVTPEPINTNPKAYDLRRPDAAFAHRPRKTNKLNQPKRKKPFKGYVWNKEDPEAAYLHNVNALKSGKTGLSNAQIEKHLLRLERLRKKEEMQKLKRERMRERQNRQRKKQKNNKKVDDSLLSLDESRIKSRNVIAVPKENILLQDDNHIKEIQSPRKSSHSIERVTQRTYVMNNQLSELHPKTIVEVHDFSNE